MARRSNGEGTVYKRSEGRWCAAYYVKGANGVVKRKHVYAKTQKAVKENKLDMFGLRCGLQYSISTP